MKHAFWWLARWTLIGGLILTVVALAGRVYQESLYLDMVKMAKAHEQAMELLLTQVAHEASMQMAQFRFIAGQEDRQLQRLRRP